MKKLILSSIFVFITTTMMNANTTTVEKNNLITIDRDCAQEAWDYGTKHGEGNPDREYDLTDAYYSGCMG